MQILGLLVLAVLGLISVTWTRIATVKTTYAYVELQKELGRLQQELQAERVRWLQLTAPKKLETLARHLGLVAPRVSQTVRIADASTAGKTVSKP